MQQSSSSRWCHYLENLHEVLEEGIAWKKNAKLRIHMSTYVEEYKDGWDQPSYKGMSVSIWDKKLSHGIAG